MVSLRSYALAVALLLCATFAHAQADGSNVKTIHPTFTTIDVPGAGYTNVWAINASGDVVGNYGQDTSTDSHGFYLHDGSFEFFDYPGQNVTVPTGVNDSNLVVGYAGTAPFFGFSFDGVNFTLIKDGGNSATASLGINNLGEIVGGTGTIYTTTGFKMKNGRFRPLNVQGEYVYVYGSAVNNFGTIVGWTDSNGFICRGSMCGFVNYPLAFQTAARGINDSGIVVGWYSSSGCTCAFASRHGKYASFGYPGADTYATGINNSGYIVGAYTFDYQTWHGFVTSQISLTDLE